MNTNINTSINKLDLILSITQDWYISELKKSNLVNAFLLNWTPIYTKALIEKNPDYILRNGIEYSIYYYRNELPDYNQAKKMALSFRSCKKLNINVVLIRSIY